MGKGTNPLDFRTWIRPCRCMRTCNILSSVFHQAGHIIAAARNPLLDKSSTQLGAESMSGGVRLSVLPDQLLRHRRLTYTVSWTSGFAADPFRSRPWRASAPNNDDRLLNILLDGRTWRNITFPRSPLSDASKPMPAGVERAVSQALGTIFFNRYRSRSKIKFYHVA